MGGWRHRRSYCGSGSDYEYRFYSRRYGDRRKRRPAVQYVSQGRVATTTLQHTCSACGRFRSPNWQARHPLLPGEVPKPSLCKACRAKSTSSDDSDCSLRGRKRHRRRHHQRTPSCSHTGHECPGRPCSSHTRHCHHPSKLTPSPSHDNVNIVIENDVSMRSGKATVVDSTMSSEEDVEVVRKIVPHARSRSSFIIDEREYRYPRRRRSLSSIRYVRSRSPHSARFVDKLDDLPPPRRRSRSTSRVSFADEPEEIILPKPQNRHRRVRVCYDGADSGQSEAQNMLEADQSRTSRENEPANGAELLEDPASSAQRRPERMYSRACSPVNQAEDQFSQRCRPGVGRPSLLVSDDVERVRANNASYCSLGTTSVESFVDAGSGVYDNGLLWNRPKEGSSRYASSKEQPRRSRSRTSENVARPRKRRRRYDKASNHADSDSGGALSPPRKSGYRYVSAPMLQVPQTDTARRGNMQTPTALTPDHPDHPDHLAYLLSAHHITPVETAPGEWEYYENRNSPLSADYSLPATPIDPLHSYNHSTYSASDGYGRTGYEPRTMSEMDYDEAAYYEAKGREYMLRLEAEKAAREHWEQAYA